MITTNQSVTEKGIAPSDLVPAGICADEILRRFNERDELLKAVMGLRRAWIAPHRYPIKSAEEQLMSVSDKIAPNWKWID